jgi:hypothetical protein
MSNYTISLPNGQRIFITEKEGNVIIPFDSFRTFCEKQGWQVIPFIEDEPVHTITFRGVCYDFFWKDGRLVDITADDKEITWQELPEQVKGLL